MSLRLVSTLAGNVDAMAVLVAERLTLAGTPCFFDATASAEHLETVQDADLIWMCGYLASQLIDSDRLPAKVVAAPDFAGEVPASYRTLFVGRSDETAATQWAMNEPNSWSGNHSVHVYRANHSLLPIDPERVLWTGSHVQSLEALAASRADIAPIDSTVWLWARELFPTLEVRYESRPWPAPPLLLHTDHASLHEKISLAIAGPYDRANLTSISPAIDSHCDPIRKAVRAQSNG